MTAKCPACGWTMGLVDKRPAENAQFICPQCSKALIFSSHNLMSRILMILVFIPAFFLIRLDETRSWVYATIAGSLVLALMVFAFANERLRLNETFE